MYFSLSQQALDDTLQNANDLSCPMLVVGQFLNVLLVDHTLPHRHSTFSVSHRRHPSATTCFAQPLYYCPTYSQMDFLRLILSVFSGIPEAYQVLRCLKTTTEEDLSLFLKMVERHHTHYLVLNVNKLPFKLQEVHACIIYEVKVFQLLYVYSIWCKSTWQCKESFKL